MRTLLVLLLLAFAASASAQDDRFRLQIGFEVAAAKPAPVDVRAELGKRFEAAVPASADAPQMRLEGEILRSMRGARGREQLDIAVSVLQQSDASWTRVADTTLKVFVGKRGELTIEDAEGNRQVSISALATRL